VSGAEFEYGGPAAASRFAPVERVRFRLCHDARHSRRRVRHPVRPDLNRSREEGHIGLFGNMYEKRKQKIASSAAQYLEAGETPGAAAICQPQNQAAQAVWGKKPYEQYLVTATERNLYVFLISPFKNEVLAKNREIRPLETVDARMDGPRAVIGEFHLAPMPAEKHLPGLVEFVHQRHA